MWGGTDRRIRSPSDSYSSYISALSLPELTACFLADQTALHHITGSTAADVEPVPFHSVSAGSSRTLVDNAD